MFKTVKTITPSKPCHPRYATLNTKNRDVKYSFLNIRLYAVKELEIPQEYIDLKDIANKEATHTLLNPMLVKYKIDIGDKKSPFGPLYNLLENKLVVLR